MLSTTKKTLMNFNNIIIENNCKIQLNESTFFNAHHVLDRDLTIEILKIEIEKRRKIVSNSNNNNNNNNSVILKCLDCFSGSGIRSLRCLNDDVLKQNIQQFAIDKDLQSIENIQINAKLNNIPVIKIESNDLKIIDKEFLENEKNSLTLFHSEVLDVLKQNEKKFDFIDLDPFGSVSNYLPFAIKSLSKLFFFVFFL